MSPTSPRLLIVDDDPALRTMLAEVLADRGIGISLAESAERALDVLESERPDLVLLDMKMPGMGGLGLLRALGNEAPPVVVMTAFAEVEDAVEAMKLGAKDYLKKPLDLTVLHETLLRHVGGEPAQPTSTAPDLDEGWIFRSPLMLELLDELRRVARTRVPVLLCGETGTGKEVLARLLHDWSDRSDGPRVSVNLAALPEGLVEAELFGAQRGAYTGADQDRAGRFESAAGGTIFLDEIGEIPATVQPKLLRVLETGKFARLGGGAERSIDVRLVTATNRDLESEVEAGRFRQDLYYRLAVITLEVPPLRERTEEILPLARSFVAEAGPDPKQITPATEERLRAWTWPGNIRELRNAMLRAAILAPGDRILPEHLPPQARNASLGSETEPRRLADIERDAIFRALRRWDGNRTRAARELGISRRKLLYRLRDYGQDGR